METHRLEATHTNTRFAMNCHSNVGLLQADSNSVTLVRDAMVIEAATPNFHLADNRMKFCKWVRSAYSRPCAFLPNLYYPDNSLMPSPPLYNGGTLRMGAFGATRALKNFTSAAGAALDISRRYKSNLELWVSAGERKAAGKRFCVPRTRMLDGLSHVKLIENGWQSWPKFRQSACTRICQCSRAMPSRSTW